MRQKVFFSATAGIFAVIAVLHFLRMMFAWEATIGGWRMPMWASGIAFIAGVYLSYQSLRLRKDVRESNREFQHQ